jgi:hypothetical protein
MTNSFHLKCFNVALSLRAIIVLGSCNLVGEDHEINANWTFVGYQTDSYITFDTLVTLNIENSTKIKGIGPNKNYHGSIEIWKDGTIQLGNLCCGDTSGGDSTELPQLEYYSYLNGSTEYELNGNNLFLRGPNSEMRFEK